MGEKKPSRNYRDLVVWQDSIQLAKATYKLTEKFPKHETYALADQIRRAAVSVPSNIAEGQARKSPGDFRRFLHFALGSLAEVYFTRVRIAFFEKAENSGQAESPKLLDVWSKFPQDIDLWQF